LNLVTPQLRARLGAALRATAAPVIMGRLVRVTGLILEASVPGARVGDFVEVGAGAQAVRAAVVGFRDHVALAVPYGGVDGLAPGARVVRIGAAGIPVSAALVGRVVDPFGVPLDGGPEIVGEEVSVEAPAPPALSRAAIARPVETGVRAIDALLTLGHGQRVGIFAGAGVGKTQLIRQIANQTKADVVVFGLIGERGNEVRDLLDADVSARSVLVVSTSDRSPLERARGALAATSVAEYFRDRGMDVLLIVDSLTRYAMSLREIGLAAGEPPTTKGYPPSVFAALPRLLERVAPMRRGGSITGVYTVLVEGDDLADPVADSARSLLDGHIVLSRDLAARGHFPAIDVLHSASRVARQVTAPETQLLAQRARAALAARREVEELKSLGAYVAGTNPASDEALATGLRLDGWSRQRQEERSTTPEALNALAAALDRRGDRK
jgi:flagellum-specific ATP synthase